MKQLLLLLLIGMLSWTTMAQSTDSSVVFRANFLKNELQRYDISKTQYTINRKDTIDMLRIGFNAEAMVSDSMENSYILKWKISNYTVNTSDVNLQKLMSMATPVVISYSITKAGVFKEFLNEKAVNACLETSLPKVLESFKGLLDSSSKSEVAKIYALREDLETMILRSMTQFHEFHGLGYTLGEVVDVPVEIFSRFTAKPLPGIQRKKLTTIDRANQIAVMSYATVLDMAGYRKVLSDNLKTELENLKTLQQTEIGGMVINLPTGWPIWSMNQRESKAGMVTYGEQLEIQYK